MGRRLCTLIGEPFGGRLLGYATGAEFGHEVRPLGSADEALRAAAECDLLLFHERTEAGTRFVREITLENPGLDVLVLGDEDSRGALPYYEAGATGYIGPDATEEEILAHLRANQRGETLVDPRTARRLVHRLTNLSRALEEREFDPARCADLTDRELEICRLLAKGEANAAIGEALEIAPGTVKSHLHNIYGKLDVSSRHVAAALWRIWDEDREAERP